MNRYKARIQDTEWGGLCSSQEPKSVDHAGRHHMGRKAMIADALYDEATSGTRIHVIPLNDMRDHQESADCWCAPRAQTFDGGGMVFVHNSMDGRELVERHGLQ